MKPLYSSIGSMNERITLEAEIRTPDLSGGYSVIWQPVTTLWALATPLSAREKWDAGQVTASAAYRFTVRQQEDIDTTQRLNWKGKIFNIRSVTPQPGRQFIDITAEEGTAI